MSDDPESDQTDRIQDDGPFRRLIIDARTFDALQKARTVEILSETLGQRADAGDLLVFVTRVRGGGPRWYVLASNSAGQELPRELLDAVGQKLSDAV